MDRILTLILAIWMMAASFTLSAPPDRRGAATNAGRTIRRLAQVEGEVDGVSDETVSSPTISDAVPMGPSPCPPPPPQHVANLDWDAQPWMSPYLQRAADAPEMADVLPDGVETSLPAKFSPWWDALVRSPAGIAESALRVDVDWLVQSALENSPYVQTVSTEPRIRRTYLVEEQAQFDWRSFLRSSFVNTNEPVGNTLTTGNNDTRYRDHTWTADGGFRRRGLGGGEVEVSQKLGRQANNSRFLVPQPQATARLELSYLQPLLNGSGRAYNQSRIVLAQIEANLADDELLLELQEHLLRVTQAYWELYRSRAVLLQRQRVLREAVAIRDDLVSRQELDSLERQILRESGGRQSPFRNRPGRDVHPQRRIAATPAGGRSGAAQLRPGRVDAA